MLFCECKQSSCQLRSKHTPPQSLIKNESNIQYIYIKKYIERENRGVLIDKSFFGIYFDTYQEITELT